MIGCRIGAPGVGELDDALASERPLEHEEVPVRERSRRVDEAQFVPEEPKAVAGGFLADRGRGHAMMSNVALGRFAGLRLAVDDGQKAAGFEAAPEALHHPVVCAQLVIGVDDENDIETLGREMRVVVAAQYRGDLRQRARSGVAIDVLERRALDVDRVDPAGRADPLGEMKCEVAGAGADIGNPASRPDAQKVHHDRGPLPVVPVSDFRMLRGQMSPKNQTGQRADEEDPNSG